MERNTCYLVGNAHLDPLWQWRWQEGSMEAKATLRSALDRMQEFPEFRFVCSSASVFQWVEEFAPDMLEEIKQRVRKGRFAIVGGWHVQPDCNLPSGEAFARQSLYAQRYFQDTFGVTATVGYCVDSFGHCATLPMILRGSGMDSYIFMRPAPHEKDMDSDVFRWEAPDGSTVTAYRILDPYCAKFDTLEALETRIQYLETESRTELPMLPVFYGVGNHGGGPTVRHLELLREYAGKHPDKKLIYSDLRDFFDQVESHPIPAYRGDLQHHASGCYATEPRVKTAIRRAENDLLAAERYSILALKLCGKAPKTREFHEAWDAVCFCHFHDSMDGCCIKEAHEDTLDMLGMAKYTAAVQENNALQTIAWNIDTRDRSLGQPLAVFNPHSFPVTACVQVNGNFDLARDAQGNPVPSQKVLSSSQECYARPDTIFQATVPPMGYRVYFLTPEGETPVPATPAHAELPAGSHNANIPWTPVLENEYYTIRFDSHSGYICSFVDKETGRELISGNAAVPVVMDEYYHDTWSHAKNFFTDQMARFSDAQVTILENGPVRATVKVVSRYNDSVLTQYFSLEAGSRLLSVRAKVDWRERHKMLKLAWPMAVEEPEAYYEIPFGIMQRPCDGEEEPGLHWTAVKGKNGGFALINNNTYSSSVQGSTLYQTVLRSPIFGDHGRARTPESDFMAQGITEFSYGILPCGDSWTEVIRAGKVLNKGLTNILDTWHDGKLPAALPGLEIDAPNVMVSALKEAEKGTGTVLRLYETEGKETTFTAKGLCLPAPLEATLTPWSVQTWCWDGSRWQKTLLTETPEE